MTIRQITFADPFVRRFLSQQPGTRDDSAWTYEAVRRIASVELAELDYDDDEPTWAWRLDMLEALRDMPVTGNLNECELDPNGPGYGIHIFNNPIDNIVTHARLVNRSWVEVLGGLREKDIENDRLGKARPDGHLQMLHITHRGVRGWPHMIPKEVIVRDIQRRPAGSAPNSQRALDDLNNQNPAVHHAVACKIQALLKAKAVAATDTPAPRSMRRQAKRGGMDMSTHVRVVGWLPVKDSTTNGSSTNGASSTDHQGVAAHWVSGHIRQQYYPSVQQHRAIYIAPHRRGDEAKAKVPTVNVVRKGADDVANLNS